MTNQSLSHHELVQKLNHALREASTATILIHTTLAESLGLNVTDWKCGELVKRHGRLTAGQLAEMTGLTTGTITGIIDRLESAHFVRRVSDAYDRRKVWVEETHERDDEIHQRLEAAFQPVLAWMGTFSHEQLTLLLNFTQRSTELLTESATRLRQK